MRHITIILLLISTVLCGAARSYSVDEVPNVQLQDHTKHLVNPDGIISEATARQIDTLLLDARRKASVEIVAVVVDNIDTDDIDGFATDLFNSWGIGKSDKNNGILILVAKDGRAATIRTGYGAEGVLPDILAGRIVRQKMIPNFREGDYERGVLAAVEEVHRMVTDEQARQELMSDMHDNYQSDDIDGEALWKTYLTISCIVAVAMLAMLLWLVVSSNSRKLSDYQKYNRLKKWQTGYWIGALVFLGIPLLAPLIMWLLTRYYRNHPRRCRRCHAWMKKLDEESDNQYLTYAQDLEEKIKSVDYDVWLCPQCDEKDIYSFVNRASSYTECPSCKARTLKLSGTRILQEPTYRSHGVGEKLYTCLNCHYNKSKRYNIPKKEAPVVVVGSGGGGRGLGGGFGGGGFGGGFGGGLTGGGGATGRW